MPHSMVVLCYSVDVDNMLWYNPRLRAGLPRSFSILIFLYEGFFMLFNKWLVFACFRISTFIRNFVFLRLLLSKDAWIVFWRCDGGISFSLTARVLYTQWEWDLQISSSCMPTLRDPYEDAVSRSLLWNSKGEKRTQWDMFKRADSLRSMICAHCFVQFGEKYRKAVHIRQGLIINQQTFQRKVQRISTWIGSVDPCSLDALASPWSHLSHI